MIDAIELSDRAVFAEAVREGLGATPKRLCCSWFYDRAGSRLFERICRLPAYYLPRAEREILSEHRAGITQGFGPDADLVDLGSGNSAKTRLLVEELLRRNGRLRYVPLDIEPGVLEEGARALLADFPSLQVLAIAAEYGAGLSRLAETRRGPRLVLWLGSNIGNLERDAAARFLARMASGFEPGDRLVVGIDLRKEPGVLVRAYDDSAGVTARFNLNLLARINRELGGAFDLAAFRHRALYDRELGRIEMWIDSARAQRVRIEALDLELAFARGEGIHTESSYKYSPREIEALAEAAGLSIEAQWLDRGGRFCVARFARARA